MMSGERDRFDDLPILAEVRDQLEARYAHSGRRRARRWAGAGLRGAPMVLAGLAAVAVVVLALGALRHGHVPAAPAGHAAPPATPRPVLDPTPAEQKLIALAQRRAAAGDHSCRQPVNQGKTFIQGRPPAALRAALGVLRRPAPPRDRTYQTLIKGGFDIGAGVYVNGIRRARTTYGKAFYLIPEARTTPFGGIPPACDAKFAHALRALTVHTAATERARLLALQTEAIATQRRVSTNRAGLCFAAVTVRRVAPPNGVDMGCSPGVPPLPPGMGMGLGEDHRHGGALIAGIVPDGVTFATIHYPAGGGDPARTLTSRAVNNVVVFEVPPHTYHQDFPTHYVLRAADGSVLARSSG